MKCQPYFLGKKKKRKASLLSAEYARSMVLSTRIYRLKLSKYHLQ